MDARFTAEQDGIRLALRELLRRRCGPGESRSAADTPAGYDPELWTALARQLGLPGLALPERYGGVGCSATELALACEETGRVLAATPLLGTSVLVAPLVLALGTDAQRADLLPRIASGSLTATLAVPPGTALALTDDNRGDWAGGGRAGGVQARPVSGPPREDTTSGGTGAAPAPRGGWRLYGQVDQVLDGHSADLLLVAAHAGGFARSRILLFLVAGDAPGLVRTRLTALDATRPQGRVQLRDVEAELLGAEDGADVLGALARTGDTAAAVLACEAVGAADRALETTVEYVGQREQFGRAIGSFQAVKHRLADVYVQLQAARSAAYFAAWAAVHEEQRVGGLALAQALEALRTAAAEGIQLHGGIGFTWEHEAQRYFKRAAADELLFGPAHRLRAHAADAAQLFERAEVTV
ncbi:MULTISPECIES: acyl-CoA dehydrogenase family protein [Streptomyces]|uniref:Pimeloyl-CoA dehydrogenase, small subunit n=1 Tax=Streptomyces sviceus (strain ATCC 29083 / DSM 924 / JCM 4929 / NBRC 13980 / NCIMB 11184 / NRRL 5439 / UC 5370) TaxID=463191 RepID=B5HL66_STRX2|nr:MULTISPECIES: acyl-CoA dehydrogenase family protein [Streptomyces]EDY53571.2 pimeloyl-CoA dehydrogenase, small subunit [Streptomyces sviceus ATCC 29083]MYT06537.1 acyl-CoA dehydrogenase [Streptomyces sp. SID5470]